MGIWARSSGPSLSNLIICLISLTIISLTAIILYKVDDVASQTRTVVGHNLEPTPWHLFPAKNFEEESRHSRNFKIVGCSYLSCRSGADPSPDPEQYRHSFSQQAPKCPAFFRWIHHDLHPWHKTRISKNHLVEAKKYAAFRVVIVGGKLYVDLYYDCVQSRTMFTVWSLLQLLRRFPGMVPDVDMMFDCMDKPTVSRAEHEAMPLPLFRYCTNADHFDIPFPDWSFWGWPETNLGLWDEEFQEIKQGSQKLRWEQKTPLAYWKGNPDVSSPIRMELLLCNDTELWGARIMRQNWTEEKKSGFGKSKLSNQCTYRYKIYAEGYAWSVSLKYIISCGCVPLIITPQYEDFFSRGLTPMKNYWPVSSFSVCSSIKFAVDLGNSNPEQAERIGLGGQRYMEHLSMERVYDYMYHLISGYANLLDFKPEVPSSAQEVCTDSLLCFANPKQRKFLERSATSPSKTPPCSIQTANMNAFNNWIRKKQLLIQNVRDMENRKAAEIQKALDDQKALEEQKRAEDQQVAPEDHKVVEEPKAPEDHKGEEIHIKTIAL